AMQRGSFFVKEHIVANTLFMSYAQMKVFTHKDMIQERFQHPVLHYEVLLNKYANANAGIEPQKLVQTDETTNM
ncbi:hypothetical protein L9F63_013809, partial [Diploptera punctata]